MKNTVKETIIRIMDDMNIGETRDYSIPCFDDRRFVVINKTDDNMFYIEASIGRVLNGSRDTIISILDKFSADLQEIGKYLIGDVRDDTNRVFVDRLSDVSDLYRKRGWWDVFSLSENTPSKGQGKYLFSLSRITFDKDGNKIAILKEIKYIEGMSKEAMVCMTVRNPSKFIYPYGYYTGEVRLKNFDEVIKTDVLSEVLNDSFNEKEFLERLNAKTPDEMDLNAFYTVGHQHNHPLYRKIQRMDFSRSKILDYVYRIRERYDTLKLGDDTDIISKAIAVENYYDALHKAAKEKKKEERKKKKAQQ